MTQTNVPKYAHPAGVNLPDRTWPAKQLTGAPQWCSVDLRDGNQALPNPLGPKAKLEYFQLLCDVGFKHIEVAFPSASQDDFEFTRQLIDEGLVPDDVFIMGLTQCRSHLIDKTFEALKGAKQAIVHAYVATSDLHIEQVFGRSREGCIEMAVAGAKQIRQLAEANPETDWRFEFSPEEFTDSDIDFVLQLCQAVYDAWGMASAEKPLIFNLPATVERRPPNQYADMIEYFCRKFPHRQNIQVSLHSHNDQGMAVAATELSILAGGDRVEGTLFGHGERTGNVDIVTVANNLRSRGVEPGLDFTDLPRVAATVERLTGMRIYYRQPYAGEYVFTAFSGSHQDAIRKGMRNRHDAAEKFGMRWKVPYLHIDPADLGRKYQGLIRINSQSGKGGVAWVLEQEFGLEVPRAMHPELGAAVQAYSEQVGREITSEEVLRVFQDEFVNPDGPFELVGYWPRPDDTDPTQIHGQLKMVINNEAKEVSADGNGPLSAFVHCLKQLGVKDFDIKDYFEQAVGGGEDARAMAYLPLVSPDGNVLFGVGTDTNIDQAAVRAIVAGLNRAATQNTKS
ncbi:MAG: 2-isopropylmalate synthase [Phycisphaerae bacterium]